MTRRRPYPESMRRAPRLTVGALVIAAHLALLALARSSPAPHVLPPAPGWGGTTTLAYIQLFAPASPPAPAPAPPPPPTPDPPDKPPIEHPEDLGLPAPRTDIEPEPLTDPSVPPSLASMAGLLGPVDRCGLAQLLRGQLQADPKVAGALALIPRPARSVADAIMVWDGQWVPLNAVGGETGVEPLHAAIVEGLDGAPADCKEMVNNGPFLIPIVDATGTTVLAVGSGAWRAADLIAQAEAAK